MIPIDGAFYKNGRKIGDVLSATQEAAAAVFQQGQAVPLEERAQIRIVITGNLRIGLGANQDRYEVDSGAVRVQVFVQTAGPVDGGTSIVVTLEP